MNGDDQGETISRLLRDNGLTLVMLLLFLMFLTGHALAGYCVDCQDRRDHGEVSVSFGDYLISAPFAESVFENWESEFLQMASYIILTAMLYQRGSAESQPLPDEKDAEREFNSGRGPEVAARYSWGYQHSLSLTLAGLFLFSWFLHGFSGRQAHNAEQLRHGGSPLTLTEYFASAQFWFESLQNWQSEYLSIAVLIVLSIFLRERNSPESKPLAAGSRETG